MNLNPVRAIKSILATFTGSSYPFPPGAQNKDNFERNIVPFSNLSQEAILKLSAVWACGRLISETISTLPFNVYERKADGTRQFAPNHWAYDLLHNSPNEDMTPQSFFEAYSNSMVFNGTAYAKKNKIGNRVVSVDFLPFDVVRTTWDYRHLPLKYQAAYGATIIDIAKDEMWKSIGYTMDGITGLSPLRYGARIFQGAQSAEAIASKTFAEGLGKSIAFMLPTVLKSDQRKEFKDAYRKEIAGERNVGNPLILEGGMTATEVGIDPETAQLLESRAFSVEEICRFMRVPPILVGHGEKNSSWPTSTEMQGLLFVTFCLRPWLTRIEQSVSKFVLGPDRARYFGRFAIEGLLRADAKTRAEFYSSAVQNGWMTRTQVADLEDLPRPQDGDIYTAQSNLMTLENLKKQGTGDTGGAAGTKESLIDFLGLREVIENAVKNSGH